MEVPLAVVRIVVAVVLLASALEKLRASGAFINVLRDLGLVRVRSLWLTVCAAELLAAMILIVPAPSPLAAVAVAVLGLVFAIAGVRALQLGKKIHCACFGQAGRRALGWPQILALPLWSGAAVAIYSWAPSTTEERTALLAAIIILLPATRAYPLVRGMLAARGDRLAVSGALQHSSSPSTADVGPMMNITGPQPVVSGGGK